MKILKKLILAGALAGLGFDAFAATTATTEAPASAVQPPIPKALQMAVQGGLTVIKSFPAADGFTGWVMKQPDGQSTIVYSTSDGNYVMTGALVDAKGQNLTTQYAQDEIPHPGLDLLEKSTYIAEGTLTNPKTIVYSFMDPNCPFCNLEWKAFQPYEKIGLQVRWIPVAFLKPDSANKAAELIESKQPLPLMQQLQTKFEMATETGGIKGLSVVSDATKLKLKENSNLMKAFGFNGTPAMVFVGADGKAAVHPGMVRLSELPELLKLPAQPNNYPELNRFK